MGRFLVRAPSHTIQTNFELTNNSFFAFPFIFGLNVLKVVHQSNKLPSKRVGKIISDSLLGAPSFCSFSAFFKLLEHIFDRLKIFFQKRPFVFDENGPIFLKKIGSACIRSVVESFKSSNSELFSAIKKSRKTTVMFYNVFQHRARSRSTLASAFVRSVECLFAPVQSAEEKKLAKPTTAKEPFRWCS